MNTRPSGGDAVPTETEYCSYIFGQCAIKEGSLECRNRNPVACRTCRQKIEAVKEVNSVAVNPHAECPGNG